MPQAFTATGGARVGWTNATWPLARLSASSNWLTVSIQMLGTYDFLPSHVIAIERYTIIPILGWGIRIRHLRADYPEKVIFWCLGDPDSILEGIRDAGFQPAAVSAAPLPERGMAVRWSAIVVAVVVWNTFFLADFARASDGALPQMGVLSLIPLLLAFAFSVGTLVSSDLQRLILKPGRHIGEIRPFLRLLVFVSGLLLVIFSIVLLCGGFDHPVDPQGG